MNSFDVDNGMLREPITLRRDSDEHLTTCDYCDGIRNDSEMSDIDGMCDICYQQAIKAIQRILDEQEDETLLVVYGHLTEI
jgi:hypothetical protein